ncbi:hypothetical protein [Shewanella glacialipiscicola]|uniref:Lipoprotein n=2 Tax=Shewanella glacialipiscicola TaxID=614069 RepID=A0ABQ6J2U7_9GAMM|nr:hypothetical protein [Shewanella glacialipiscicola]MCL1084610.1 hypothetical protein [Shewanella glacialipiscicola]GMA82451.1 hypothetical protein GCM10025855_19840 [Shewanella glacialipiscicola]
MKKLLLASLVSTLLVGCGGSDDNSGNTSVPPVPVPPPAVEGGELPDIGVDYEDHEPPAVEGGELPDIGVDYTPTVEDLISEKLNWDHSEIESLCSKIKCSISDETIFFGYENGNIYQDNSASFFTISPDTGVTSTVIHEKPVDDKFSYVSDCDVFYTKDDKHLFVDTDKVTESKLDSFQYVIKHYNDFMCNITMVTPSGVEERRPLAFSIPLSYSMNVEQFEILSGILRQEITVK